MSELQIGELMTDLSRIQFTRGTASVIADAPAERRWTAPITGEAGDATIRLPRESVAASSDYIARGSSVLILSNGGCGEWFGIVTDIDDSDTSTLALFAQQPAKLLGSRYVQRTQLLHDVSSGLAATTVLSEALSSVRGLSLASLTEGGTLDAESFDPSGDAWGALTALMDATDGELHIDTQGVCTWVGALANATRYDPLLVAGSRDFQDVSYQTSIQQQVIDVFAGTGRSTWTAHSGDAALSGWPVQVSIDGTALDAQREIESRGQPAITISGGVTSDHWSIRERDYVQVAIPHAEFGGVTETCRVLARSLADGDHLMRLELLAIRTVAPTTIGGGAGIAGGSGGAGARQQPPQRVSSDGTGGSFAQAFQLLLRLLARDDGHRRRLS